MSKHIGFFLDTETFDDFTDLEKLELGNPGIGGTEYTTLLLATKLANSSKARISLYVTGLINVSQKINLVQSKDIFSALDYAAEEDTDLFVITNFYISEQLVSYIDEMDLDIATWTHIYINYQMADLISNSKQIKHNIFVGNQQYDYYLDHKIIDKSIVIFNGVNIQSENLRTNQSYNVTYLGALYYSKYFHILAKAWKSIVKKVPEAQLYVIGSGNLYNKKSLLGPLGVASEDYERHFLKFLTDSDGNLLKSVHFLGKLGEEKNNYIRNTSVGVVNPTGITECLPMSVLELSSFSIPVVTKNAWGYPDVILNGRTGLLYRSERRLSSSITKLLLDRNYNIELGNNAKLFIMNNFDIEKISLKWIDLLNNKNDLNAFSQRVSKPYFNQMKHLKIINRYLYSKLGVSFPPLFKVERILKDKIKNSSSIFSKVVMGIHEKTRK